MRVYEIVVRSGTKRLGIDHIVHVAADDISNAQNVAEDIVQRDSVVDRPAEVISAKLLHEHVAISVAALRRGGWESKEVSPASCSSDQHNGRCSR